MKEAAFANGGSRPLEKGDKKPGKLEEKRGGNIEGSPALLWAV